MSALLPVVVTPAPVAVRSHPELGTYPLAVTLPDGERISVPLLASRGRPCCGAAPTRAARVGDRLAADGGEGGGAEAGGGIDAALDRGLDQGREDRHR